MNPAPPVMSNFTSGGLPGPFPPTAAGPEASHGPTGPAIWPSPLRRAGLAGRRGLLEVDLAVVPDHEAGGPGPAVGPGDLHMMTEQRILEAPGAQYLAVVEDDRMLDLT